MTAATPVTSDTPHGPAASTGTARQVRAAMSACRRASPDLAFAAGFLDRPRRYAVVCLWGVCRQLFEIVAPGSDDEAGCCESVEGRSPAREALGLGDSEGCQGQTPEVRRQVASNVLGWLYAGRPTGRPELDGFHRAAQRYGWERRELERFANGLSSLASVRRYATWTRLHETLDETWGVAAALAWRVGAAGGSEPGGSRPGGAESDGPKAGRPWAWGAKDSENSSTLDAQVRATGVAAGMITLLRTVDEHWRAGRLVLPLDDLVRHGLSEKDVARFVEAGSAGGDERWRAFAAEQTRRVRNLLRGGARCIAATTDARARRAAAVLVATQAAALDRLDAAGGDVWRWQSEGGGGAWARVKQAGRALRLSIDATKGVGS